MRVRNLAEPLDDDGLGYTNPSRSACSRRESRTFRALGNTEMQLSSSMRCV